MPIKFLFVAALCAYSQAGGPDVSFEVAAVRASALPPSKLKLNFQGFGRFSPRESISGGPGSSQPDYMEYQGISLKRLLSLGYGIPQPRISGPAWLDDTRFDISAKAPSGATEQQVPFMLRSLLRDRFHAQVRLMEQVRLSYTLGVLAEGPKMRKSPVAGEPSVKTMPQGEGRLLSSFRSYSMDDLARWLRGPLSVAADAEATSGDAIEVENGTRLDGRYDFDLEYSAPSRARPESGGVELRIAVSQQLKLTVSKTSRGILSLIVDSIDRMPDEN